MKWNYDLETIPRGCPLMIRTIPGTSRVATVAEQDRPFTGRIRCMTVVNHRRMYATAWRHLTAAEIAELPDGVGFMVHWVRNLKKD